MFAMRRTHLELEMVKWAVLIVTALALAWAVAVQTAGGGELTKLGKPAPQLMPMPNVDEVFAPTEKVQPFFPEIGPKVTAVDPVLGEQLWAMLNEVQPGNDEGAAEAWKKLRLPADAEVWRQIALGVIAMRNNDAEAAAVCFDTARMLQPRNPVVAYYMGMLRLDQAAEAGEGEMIPQLQIALVAYPPRVAPAVRGMFQIAAMMEFRDAITWAEEINLADPVAATAGREGPTIGDFLTAFDAVNYVGRAHHMLGQLYLDRGMLTDAEEHFDAAHQTGVPVPYGYRELGEAFGEQDRDGDAARAYLKALGENADGLVRPGRKVIEHLERMFRW